ncbi:hypothetical protein BH10ACT1_BH10ACT1_40120 [soil metagenome]
MITGEAAERTEDDVSVEPADARWWHGREAVSAAALTALALLPVLVVVATRAGRPYLPVQDVALIDMRVRDVWTSDIPLVGAYSRFGWSHPGPSYYYLLAPLSFLTGGAAWATLVGSALLQGVAIAWTALIAWKRGRLPVLALWLAIVVLACSATGPYLLLEAWNPHPAVPFFALFLLQAWLLATGDDDQLVGGAFVASFLVQAHVGYVPLVVPIAAWALWRRRSDLHAAGGRLRTRPQRRAAAIVLALFWLPPILENVIYRPGNVFELVRAFFFGEDQSGVAGFVKAAGLLGAPFRLLPSWLGGSDQAGALAGEASPAPLLWLLVPAALLVLAWRSTRGPGKVHDRRLVELSLVALLAGCVALSRVSGELAPYLFYWRLVLGPFVVLGTVTVLLRDAANARPALRSGMVAAAAVAVAWASVAMAFAVADHPRAVMAFEPEARELIDQVTADGTPGGTILVRSAGSPLGGVQGGVFDELDRRGADVRVDRRRPFQFGHGRNASRATADRVWYVVEDGLELSLLSALPGAEVVARTSPLPSADEAELVTLQRRIAGQLRRAGHPDLMASLDSPLATFELDAVPSISQSDRDRLSHLDEQVQRAGRCRCAIVAFDSDDAPCVRAIRLHTAGRDLRRTCEGKQ